MIMTENKVRFIELSRLDAILIPTEDESTRQLIESLNYSISIYMAWESAIGTTFHQAVKIA